MISKMSHSIISYTTDILFGTGNTLAWFIPVYAIHGGRFNKAAAIRVSRQAVGAGMARSLYRPVARNSIKWMLPMKVGSGK